MVRRHSFERPVSPMQAFFQAESSSGILLMVVTVLALVVANTGLRHDYAALLETPVGFGLGEWQIRKGLILWINDGLMAVFFLLIGLEIKREILFGELSSWKSASLPVMAAICGCLVPAGVFYLIAQGTEHARGWAIPMATDIAFALGVLTLLGKRIPPWAKIFLTALAVVDDLIAVLVIALFYTAEIKLGPLMLAGGCLAILILLNARKVSRLGPYLLIGVVLWFAVLKSGIHATVAGVLIGFTIPAGTRTDRKSLLQKAELGLEMLRQFVGREKQGEKEMLQSSLDYLGDVVVQAEAPLYRLEHKLHGWVAFVIVPIFAFANAGVSLQPQVLASGMAQPLSWAIILGLFLGKQLGILGAVWAMARFTGLPQLKAPGMARLFWGLSCLGGIGFTMSLFVAGLSFTAPEAIELSKIGILLGSMISAILGVLLLRGLPKPDLMSPS